PSFNTCAYYFHEKVWQSLHPQKKGTDKHFGCAH
ncbi:MAG: DUF2061 domain-containing protein, partial [Vibrio metschnikovii]